MKNTILLIDKPAGWTSFDVVAKIRGMRRAYYAQKGEKPTKRQLKVGHTGTLDPFATGLLIILLGDATKKADDFLKLDKVYEATIRLGQTSTTGDPEGEITDYRLESPMTADEAHAPSKRLRSESQIGHAPLEAQAADVSEGHEFRQPALEEVREVVARFTGEIEQRPPIFSAIKINGKRAYKLARDGQEVEITLRKVTIHSLEILDYTYPELRIRTHVSSGTYIRSLAVDIGEALGTGAYCSQLRRLSVGTYDIKDAKTFDQLESLLKEDS